MSGGHFDHNEWHIDGIAEIIEELIASNKDDSLDEWGYTRGGSIRMRRFKSSRRPRSCFARLPEWYIGSIILFQVMTARKVSIAGGMKRWSVKNE